jgi:hypothetical protein
VKPLTALSALAIWKPPSIQLPAGGLSRRAKRQIACASSICRLHPLPANPGLPQPCCQPDVGTSVIEANLRPNEFQDLADSLGELGNAAAGFDVKYYVRIELGNNPSKDILERVNQILQKIKSGMRF